jgi:subtilisin family serine protease
VIRRLAFVLLLAGLVLPASAASFAPSDPLAPKQWYLSRIHAFDFWPDVAAPTLAPVRVAIVDSGLDLGHPEFAGRVVAKRSFVGGDVLDRQGHGTFVAGIIAANSDNGQGIAGIALSAQLLIAKVVRSDGTISPIAEAKAIRWAADNGARVINLSLGGLRAPRNKSEDTYSPIEQDAIEYAYAKGAVLVAAVGNGDQAPQTPWDFASWPAALPHVIGVSAVAQDGSVPSFSNRDANFNDIAAPGVGIVSTLPRALTAARPSCPDQGYSICGPAEFRTGEGTSYAAAQVSAAAALMIAAKPTLTASQVTTLLERSATDANPSTGCRRCVGSRDEYTGWGELDVNAALRALGGALPTPDRYESNDDAGSRAFGLWGRSIDLSATLDFWDDQIDVYKIRLRRGQTVAVSLRGPPSTRVNLVLWRPGTQQVEGLSPALQARRLTQSVRGGPNAHFLHRARQDGWYYVEVKMSSPGSGQYRLHISKSRT